MHLESLSLFLATASLSLFAGDSISQPEINNQLPRNRRSISQPELNNQLPRNRHSISQPELNNCLVTGTASASPN